MQNYAGLLHALGRRISRICWVSVDQETPTCISMPLPSPDRYMQDIDFTWQMTCDEYGIPRDEIRLIYRTRRFQGEVISSRLYIALACPLPLTIEPDSPLSPAAAPPQNILVSAGSDFPGPGWTHEVAVRYGCTPLATISVQVGSQRLHNPDDPSIRAAVKKLQAVYGPGLPVQNNIVP